MCNLITHAATFPVSSFMPQLKKSPISAPGTCHGFSGSLCDISGETIVRFKFKLLPAQESDSLVCMREGRIQRCD